MPVASIAEGPNGRVALGAQTEAAADEMFDRVVPVLVRGGYRMAGQAGHTTVFERSSLVEPILLLILFPPLGLIALLLWRRETITFVSGDAALEA